MSAATFSSGMVVTGEHISRLSSWNASFMRKRTDCCSGSKSLNVESCYYGRAAVAVPEFLYITSPVYAVCVLCQFTAQ